MVRESTPGSCRAALTLCLMVTTLLMSTALVGAGTVAGRTAHLSTPSANGHATPSGLLAARPSSQNAMPLAAGLTLTAPGVVPAAVSLSWTEASVTGLNSFLNYTITYSTNNSTGSFAGVAVITTQTALQYAAGSLAPGGTYWWQVTGYVAVFLGGTQSQPSNVLEVQQPGSAYLTKWAVTSTSLQLNWTNNATYGGLLGFQSYTVFESISGAAYSPVYSNVTLALRTATLPVTAGVGYAYYLNTTDCINCGATGPQDSVTDSNILTVGTPATLGASISASRGTVDASESDLLTCTPSGGSSPFAFAWSVNGSSFLPGNGSIAVTFGSSGTFPVLCNVTDSEPRTTQASISITVNPNPVLTVALSRTHVDIGETVFFNCTVSGGTLPETLSWMFGNGESTSGGTTSTSYTSVGTYTPVCSGIDQAGVSSALAANVVVSPTLSLSASGSASAAAPGTSLQFIAHPANGSGSYGGYTWTFGDGTSGAGSTVTHAFSSAGTFTVTARVNDSNGGLSSSTTTVVVAPLVVHELAAPSSGRVGSSLAFSANATGGAGGPYNYTWDFGAGGLAYGPAVTHSYSQSGQYAPTLTVTDRLGAQNVTRWPAVSISSAPSALAWLPLWVLLVIAAFIGAVMAVATYARRNRTGPAGSAALSYYVPPVGPKGAMQGTKVCAHCGASNSSLRKSCEVCGAALGRT
jgi:hypothetical protein